MTNIHNNLIKAGVQLGDELFFEMYNQHAPVDEHDPRRHGMLVSILHNCAAMLYLNGASQEFLVQQIAEACDQASDLDND